MPIDAELGQTVLVVEDDKDVRDLVAEYLVELGYRVLAAPEADTALKLLGDEPGPVELLFTDVTMPGRNGFELAVAALDIKPAIKVLFTSGYAPVSERPLLTRDMPLLRKPYMPAELARQVREILGNKTG